MLKLLLFPFSLLYGTVVFIRNLLYDFKFFKSTEFGFPVISIGNITVGGTGKTPHTEYLVKILGAGFKVAVLSRGYKRKTKGFRMAEENSTVSEVGDEPLQVKRKFPETMVSVCENRVAGVKRLLPEAPDVVLLDDAFQHRRITPGINILLIDYNRPLKNDMLLPAGRLREGVFQVRRANVIIITKCPEEITPITRRIFQKNVSLKPYQSIYFTTLVYGRIKPVFPAENIYGGVNPAVEKILLVTGIASSEGIAAHLKKYTPEVGEMAFGDHHFYTSEDIQKITDRFNQLNSVKKIIVTTEKDTMRFLSIGGLPAEIKQVLFFLPVEVKFLGQEEGERFNQKMISYVGENKSNRNLHKRANRVKP